MKLVNARLGLELEFLENQVLNLTIESRTGGAALSGG